MEIYCENCKYHWVGTTYWQGQCSCDKVLQKTPDGLKRIIHNCQKINVNNDCTMFKPTFIYKVKMFILKLWNDGEIICQ
jgi:hypothetical protein